MGPTTWIAIYGAGLSTVVFIWQILIYAQRKRVRIRVTVTITKQPSGMIALTKAVDLSDFPIKVAAFGVQVYERGWFSRIRPKAILYLMDERLIDEKDEKFRSRPYRHSEDFTMTPHNAISHLELYQFSPKDVRLRCFVELADGSRHASKFLPGYFLGGG